MRDNFEKLTAADVKVFGVSTQDAESHQEFISKNGFQFPLVVDDGTIAKAFDVPLRLGMASRQSILIDPEGKVKTIWRDVNVGEHSKQVLDALAK